MLTADLSHAKETVDTLILGEYVLTMDEKNTVIQQGAVAIKGDRIIDVGKASLMNQRYSATKILSGDNRIVMPGLINGHTHTSMTLFRGIADDLPVMDWLKNHIFPAEAALVTPEFIKTGSELACYEMIRGGTTTFADMYFYPEITAHVVERTGLRAIIGAPTTDYPSPNFNGWEDSFAAAVKFVMYWKDRSDRITPAFAPHAIYTVSKPHWIELTATAQSLSVPIHTHLAETRAEVEWAKKASSQTPLQYLKEMNTLDVKMIAAHMVHLNEQDILCAAEKNVGAIHSPTSNLKLASGAAPVTCMLSAGISVGLGTDGAASNNNLDMWQEIHLAVLLHKHENQDPMALTAETAIRMATSRGAKAIGKEKEIGQLRKGMQADVIQVSYAALHNQPLFNPFSHLVYVLGSHDVVTSMVAGKILMEEGRIQPIDIDMLRNAVNYQTKMIKAYINSLH